MVNMFSKITGIADRVLGLNPLTSVERACAATEIIASCEYLVARTDRQPGGFNDWKYLSSQFPVGAATAWDRLDETQAEALYKGIQCLRIAHNLILLSPGKSNAVRAWCNVFEAGTHLLVQPRHFYGTDGSDQISFLCNAAVGIGRLGGSNMTRKAASDFLALQVILSYFIAGVTKIPGAAWRNGVALQKVMGTQTYGSAGFHKFLARRPKIGQWLTHGTVAAEAMMPLGLVTTRSTKLTLLLFAAFHIANARFMGLGRFVLPFISTYPAIWSLRTLSYEGE